MRPTGNCSGREGASFVSRCFKNGLLLVAALALAALHGALGPLAGEALAGKSLSALARHCCECFRCGGCVRSVGWSGCAGVLFFMFCSNYFLKSSENSSLIFLTDTDPSPRQRIWEVSTLELFCSFFHLCAFFQLFCFLRKFVPSLWNV